MLVAAAAIAMVSCKGKGVCVCTENNTTSKTYYEELSSSERRAIKKGCNGDSDGKITKEESTTGGITVSDDDDVSLNSKNCKWERK